MGDIHIDPIFLDASPSVSGGFSYNSYKIFSSENKGKKKMAKGTYKLVVKDGDTKYDYRDGNYKAKPVDYVQEADNLADALVAFLEWVGDPDNEDKVSLVFVPGKRGKK